jgi:hypothetical protein
MKQEQQSGNGAGSGKQPPPGGGTLFVTLDQIVDYAKDLDSSAQAECIELMCFRLFGPQLTPEAAKKIAEIPEHFRKKRAPSIGKVITINNNGDKVEKKTVIPHVANYNESVDEQNNNYTVPPPTTGGPDQMMIAE